MQKLDTFIYICLTKYNIMSFTAFRKLSPINQLIMTGCVAILSFIILFFLSYIIAIPFVGTSQLSKVFSGANPDDTIIISLLKYFQVIQSIGLFIIPPIILGYLFEGNFWNYLNLTKKNGINIYILAFFCIMVISPFISYVGTLNNHMTFPSAFSGIENWMKNMEDAADLMIKRFIQTNSLGGISFNIFMIAIIPAIGEELLFRGVLQKIFISLTKNIHWGIWITALIFSALHFQFFGFIPRMILGALFGYLLVSTGSLWIPIFCHFINNLTGVIFLYMEKNGFENLKNWNESDMNLSLTWPLALGSVILSLFILSQIKKSSLSNKTNSF